MSGSLSPGVLSIALTGGIGSGKTAVADIFYQLGKDQGLKLIDSDQIARHLLQGSIYHSPSQALLKVKELFGDELFEPDTGELNRAILRKKLFNSPENKTQLEALLHPLVYQSIFEQLETYRKQNNIHIVITSIPLFFETAYQTERSQYFDRILVVDIPEDIQLQRSIKRDHCSKELIQQIIDSQIDRNTRLKRADDIIDNSGTLQQLKSRVNELYKFYQKLAGRQ
ncbi:MAG TPA: dephospho-CoA kinase [Aeromonadales bacterium]|nr:dephospho-CoA kinase [Aeromonadales bacterium]